MTPYSQILIEVQQAIGHLRRERDYAWHSGDLEAFNTYQEDIQEALREQAAVIAELENSNG